MNKKLLFFSFILFFVLQAESNKKNNFSSIDFDSGKKDDLSLPSDNDDKYLSIYHLDDDSQLPLDSEKKLKKDVVKKNKNSRIFEKNEIDKDDSREKTIILWL